MDVEHLRRIYDEYRRAAEQLEALRPQIDAADRLAAAQPRLDAAILHAARINAEHWRFAAEQLEALQPQLDAAILHAAQLDAEHLHALQAQFDEADRLAAQFDDEYLRFATERLDAVLASFDEHRQIAEQLGVFSQRVLVAEQAARARSQRLVKQKLEKEVSERLSSLGWYVSPHMPYATLEPLMHSMNEDPEGAVAKIAVYFGSQLDAIEQELVKLRPKRKKLLQDAFEAHRDRKYNLSIPVFLSQADGIWWDQYSQNLFNKRGRDSGHEKLRSSPKSYLFSGFLYPLSITTPLWMSEGERDEPFNELNRHQVLHGKSVDYGTEENSLKAISLLNYLCFVLNENSETEGEA